LHIVLLNLFHLDFKELSLMKKPTVFITQLMSILLITFLLGACGSSSSDDDEVVTNTSPNVDAGADQTLGAAGLVSLSATISDDDATYSITWTQTSGTIVTLSDTSSANPIFTAPANEADVILVFQISVDDGTNAAVTDSVSITVTGTATNSGPSVDAGDSQTVDSGATVTLAATITNNDDTLTIAWSQTSGDNVTLSDSSVASSTFTAPTVTEDEILVFEVSVDDGSNNVVTDTVTITVTVAPTTGESDWVINTTAEVSTHIIDSASGVGVLVDVQSVSAQNVNGKDYTVVNSQGIPKYDITITQDIVDALNNRPKASTDFVSSASGATISKLGDVVKFGQDMGLDSNSNCNTDEGFGYWPPGPDCPTEDERTVYLPNEPTPTATPCASGLGKVGLWVNGSSIYNWGDGMSYNNGGDWQNLAPVAEFYDVDICGGHAANGDYHHHFYTSCLADLVSDEGNKHSPIYGYAADGYPVYGPWESDAVLAISAWTVRDYSSDSATGCADNTRSCSLVDQFDISMGTEEVSAGPTFNAIVTTLSGNELQAYNGYYYEDYYWESTLTDQGGAYLDQYNGHTDDTRGYHYHATIAQNGDSFAASFPYIIGTRFAGQLEDNAVASCSTGEGGMGPPPPHQG
jgi:hypothetical protein